MCSIAILMPLKETVVYISCENFCIYNIIDSVIITVQIFYYSTDIFETAGVKQPDVATILVGVVLVTVTIISVSCCCHRHVDNLDVSGDPGRETRTQDIDVIWSWRDGSFLYSYHNLFLFPGDNLITQ